MRYLVSMTRISRTPPPSGSSDDHWRLQDAKARFSDLVRRAHRDGPQHVTVHGRDEVVVIAAEEYRRLRGERTGAMLIAALTACPDPDLTIGAAGVRAPVRDVEL
jgi:prevent-host-death family protein